MFGSAKNNLAIKGKSFAYKIYTFQSRIIQQNHFQSIPSPSDSSICAAFTGKQVSMVAIYCISFVLAGLLVVHMERQYRYIMNQPLFKPTSTTPPAVFPQSGFSYRPYVAQTFTPHDRPQQFLTVRGEPQQNRTTNTFNFRQNQAQSTIFTQPQQPLDSNRTLKLDSYARKVSFQEQNSTESQPMPAARLNHSIERALDARQQPAQMFPNNFQQKRPLIASEMFTTQQFRVDLNPRVQQTAQKKAPLQFPVRIDCEGRGDMRLSLNSREPQSMRKESKTDREALARERSMNYNRNISNNIKYRQFPVPQQQFSKQNTTLLDSTQSSQTQSFSLKDTIKDKQPQQDTLKPPPQSGLPKNPSPINFWPLSISPYEDKQQVFPRAANTASKETSEKVEQCPPQFKKKKPLEFLNKRKAEYVSKTFSVNDFQLLDKIGKGSFGDVYMAQQKATGFLVVLKKLQKKKIAQMKMEQHLLREIKIQSFLKHRHLTSLFGCFSDQSYIYLVLQAMPDGSLMQVKKKRKVTEAQASSYLRQICEGLKYMHTEEIIHRDIKPENIFLNDGYAKIGDFGCSIYTQSLRNTIIGSLAYISPEQLKQGSYDEKVDVWSLGVMAYEMMVGKSPYEADIIKIAKNEIAPELSELKFPPQAELSPQAKDFLVSMLHLDPSRRMGIAEALRHEFIRSNLAKQQGVSG